MAKRIIYYTAKEGCKPCADVTKLVEEGKFQSDVPTDEVDVVDITTDEGFDRFNKHVLSKGDGGVPSAFFGVQQCKIYVEKDMVFFECPSNDQSSGPSEKSPLPEATVGHDASQSSSPAESPAPQP